MEKVIIRKMFQGLPIGECAFVNQDEIIKLLASGKFTFAPAFRQESDGSLKLLELSIIPREMETNQTIIASDKGRAE